MSFIGKGLGKSANDWHYYSEKPIMGFGNSPEYEDMEEEPEREATAEDYKKNPYLVNLLDWVRQPDGTFINIMTEECYDIKGRSIRCR